LPERVGVAKAKQMLFTGIRLPAGKALEFGLVNAVWSAADFEKELTELATRIGAMNRYNLRLVKELVNKRFDLLEGHPS
jgi:enoyl-CoA hydratase/carnithine racemase